MARKDQTCVEVVGEIICPLGSRTHGASSITVTLVTLTFVHHHHAYEQEQ
jgi:hypothetical protein